MTDLPVSISINLEDRALHIGTVDHTLSNHQIQQIRTIADGSFQNMSAKKAIFEVLEEQIIPFITITGRNPDKSTIETEVKEAFGTHLYLYTNKTSVTEKAE